MTARSGCAERAPCWSSAAGLLPCKPAGTAAACPGRPLRAKPDAVAERTAREWQDYPTTAGHFLNGIKALLDAEAAGFRGWPVSLTILRTRPSQPGQTGAPASARMAPD